MHEVKKDLLRGRRKTLRRNKGAERSRKEK
jgi:hypothetical protein